MGRWGDRSSRLPRFSSHFQQAASAAEQVADRLAEAPDGDVRDHQRRREQELAPRTTSREHVACHAPVEERKQKRRAEREEQLRHWTAEAISIVTEPVHWDILRLCRTTAFHYDCRWIANQIGLPYCYRRHVHLFVNGVRRAQMFEDVQQPNGDLTKEFWPQVEEGDLHKIQLWFEFDDAASSFTATGATLQKFTTTGGVKKLLRYRWTFAKRAARGSGRPVPGRRGP